MATQDIQSLVQKMPELDVPPPAPKDPKEKPKAAHKGEKGKLTGPKWDDAAKIYDQILAGGKPAVAELIGLLPDGDTTGDHKPRYALNGLCAYVIRPGKEQARAAVIAALVEQVNGSRPKTVRAFLVRMVQQCGDASAVAALVPLLADEELCDPAAQALVCLGGDSPQQLRKALGSTSSVKCRLAIVQALGALKDAAAIDALIAAADDADDNLKITALWALARIALPGCVDAVVRASGRGDGWVRIQATKTAITLADNLAANGHRAEAAKVYEHLRDTCTEPKQAHVRDAAIAGLTGLK